MKIDEVRINTIAPHRDKRRKLTAEDRQAIRDAYLRGEASTRKLAREYGVSRRLIQFTIYPERREHNLNVRRARRKALGYDPYYDREKHNEDMRVHRAYKQRIVEDLNTFTG